MKLSPDHEAIVKETADVVAGIADDATVIFYRDMFEAHPELLNVFNEANQAIGDQPKPVTASELGFAGHLIEPDAPDLTAVIQRIAPDQVSLAIQAADYLIVGRSLLGAIGKVLGDAAPPEIIAAWDEVYWLFA